MRDPGPKVAAPELLSLHGLRVAMRVQGKGDPLLLINGMTRPQQSWDPLVAQLSGRTVVSFDAPGVGASPTPMLPLSISALAELAVAVLDAAGLDDADVLGFSHGGAVAQQLACDDPSRVRKLILAATSCGIGATPGSGRAGLRGLAGPDAGPWPRADAKGLLWHSMAFSNWSSIPFLGSITVPTLVMCGDHDRIVAPANSRVLARRIPGASLVTLAAGHNLQRPDLAGQVARVVERFLRVDADNERLPSGF